MKHQCLYWGKTWNKNGPEFDIAVDPLEGTNFVANNLPGALICNCCCQKI